MKFKIMTGDNRDTLKTLADNSIDAIVTDPPYGIDFLGKAWDANTGALETYQECLRVLKPGGHILAFSAARTYHHLAITLEQAGFEIRDQIMWIYSSGFPKAQDIGKAIDKRAGNKDTTVMVAPTYGVNGEKIVSNSPSGQLRCPVCKKTSEQRYHCGKGEECGMVYKAQTPLAQQWSGWKTALKPAHEPIALARKPFKGSTIENVLTHGTGALNIDATRVPYEDEADLKLVVDWANKYTSPGVQEYAKLDGSVDRTHTEKQFKSEASTQGRFPSNVLGEILQDDYQKYFYCPKVSRKERHIGFDDVPDPLANYAQGDVKNHPLWDPSIGTNVQRLKHKIMENNKDLGKKQDVVNSTKSMLETMGAYYIDKTGNPLAYEDRGDHSLIFIPGIGNIYTHGLKQEYLNWCKSNNQSIGNVGNNHPTVKPVELMKYLIKLITPPGGVVLDPFNGSGSTGMAAVELGFEYIGCELDPAYVSIAEKRIRAWNTPEPSGTTYEELFE